MRQSQPGRVLASAGSVSLVRADGRFLVVDGFAIVFDSRSFWRACRAFGAAL